MIGGDMRMDAKAPGPAGDRGADRRIVKRGTPRWDGALWMWTVPAQGAAAPLVPAVRIRT